MRGAILPLPQYASMAWCSVKAQGQLYVLPLSPMTPDECTAVNAPNLESRIFGLLFWRNRYIMDINKSARF
jgi:hypothetical protein